MKFKLFAFVIQYFALTSCQQIMDNHWERQELANYDSPYKGNWIGSYTGQETGTFVLDINKSGNVFGLRNNADNLGGKVYEGGVLMNLHSPTSNFHIDGNLETNSGTWKMGSLSGTWTIVKQ